LKEGKTVASTESEKTPVEYLEEASSGIRRESFEKRFLDFLTAHDLDYSVHKRQMDVFFDIADEHLRERSAMRAMKKRCFLQDYGRCEKLMDDTEKKLEKFQQCLQAVLRKSSSPAPWTSSLARSITTEISSLQRKLEERFFDERHDIALQRSILSKLALKTAGNEFTLDLVKYMADEFPTFGEPERNVLVGAVMAGAGLYTSAELESDADPVERIPMKIWRAKRHYKKYYAGEGRVYSHIKPKKQKNKQKKQAQQREKT
jgi:hypothetical protein